MSVKLRRLWIQLTGDRKRFGILCAAVLVALLFWARLIVISRAPRTAMAEDPVVVAPAPAPEPASDKTASPPQQVTLDRMPFRDPFLISEDHFPRLDPVVGLGPEAGKSGAKTTEDPVQAALRRTAQLQSLVDLFTLDAVMTQPPMAVISGKTYRPGDLVSGINNDQIQFQLFQVKQGCVILECEDRQFELKMESPGL
ncbi:MAG: hypothetical protein JSV91_14510 [Phycisphaerales bacterium]|nr:MAG: hypothetical protein JSV91_14510 [Phycisphaerales bacterium]